MDTSLLDGVVLFELQALITIAGGRTISNNLYIDVNMVLLLQINDLNSKNGFCNPLISHYNADAMRYEHSDKVLLCIGVRGFICVGFLESRLLPG